MTKFQSWIITIAIGLIALGSVWAAYESYIANNGVSQWLNEFNQIRSYDSNTSPNEPTPIPTDPVPIPKTYSE